MTGSGICVFTL